MKRTSATADTAHEHDTSPDTDWRPAAVRVVLLLILLGGILAAALALRPLLPEPEAVQREVAGAGWWVYAAAIPVLALLRFSMLPSSMATAAAGLVLGPLAGAAAAVLAAVIVACAQLWIGRHVLGEPVRAQFERRAGGAVAFVERHGWLAVAFVRLLPLPHGPFSYAAGGTTLSSRHMALGTLVGAVPMALAYATIGGNLRDPFAIEVLLSVAALVVLAGAGGLLARRAHLRQPG